MADRNHTYRKSQREARAFPRKRAVAACRVCRTRKIKCDNARPQCASCRATDAHCVYEQYPDISKFDPASILILERLDQIQQSLDATPPSPPRGVVRPVLCLQIPAARIGPDAILGWPVFRDASSPGTLNHLVLTAREPAPPPSPGDAPLDLIPIVGLVDLFLQHVHVKNPVLNTSFLSQSAGRLADHGLRWDGLTALVLLAAALGCLAAPLHYRDVPPLRPELGARLYEEALKRISLSTDQLLSAQCWFFSGVYQMYQFNPATAWTHFSHASSILSLRLSWKKAVHEEKSTPLQLDPEELALYWSCWKSECELRAELPVPNTVLSSFSVSDIHPVPPNPELFSSANVPAPIDTEDWRLLYETSWYYYLSDISLKRLEAQILNTLYGPSGHQWDTSQLPMLSRTVADFELQLDQWFENLPSIIRFEEWDEAPRQELIYNLQARVLELRSWLYQPFVYYAVHHGLPDDPTPDLERFVQKAISCSFHIIQSKPTRHRHHGSWFAARNVVSSALIILAAVKATDLVDYLVDWPDLIAQAVSCLDHWASDAPDLGQAKGILQALGDTVLQGGIDVR
ncbi:hypothetical protein BO78DRAFT_448411 [Aspergillus sclerotiicarbonarius CBS 121057]|uniref:Zn(2)-C6 fungal-type domain-containing protein n=1 Tax=Aspergillus sclerotiicarbonarius (strain CBS 121057 / IBT 28362) TaxID=1448318 RepID=A0A319ENL1_ASPSB|nr:hypothetical protein BO78DRAFT_448411 [Aspergillus sclerotiicarbonarius CBS 121057]